MLSPNVLLKLLHVTELLTYLTKQYIHAYELKNELHTHYFTCHAKNLLCLAFLLLLAYSEKIRDENNQNCICMTVRIVLSTVLKKKLLNEKGPFLAHCCANKKGKKNSIYNPMLAKDNNIG